MCYSRSNFYWPLVLVLPSLVLTVIRIISFCNNRIFIPFEPILWSFYCLEQICFKVNLDYVFLSGYLFLSNSGMCREAGTCFCSVLGVYDTLEYLLSLKHLILQTALWKKPFYKNHGQLSTAWVKMLLRVMSSVTNVICIWLWK